MAHNISLAWRNLSYEVNGWFGRGKKSILKRLTGYVKYGSLNAFLGPSGAGKTTLLNCLNGTLRQGLTQDSEIYLNRAERNRMPDIRFVEQHVHETIIARMTVGETLNYAFRFKNSIGQWKMADQHIRSVLKELLLDESILDNHFEKCSGGEQRRIAIAQELMSLDRPTFLFIDEPTTGLDSNAALLVVQCLRKLVNNSRLTILVSIHTPNSETLALFDKVFVLAKGGVCIYSDAPENLRNNLKEKINGVLLSDKPPIEEYLDIACQSFGSEDIRKLTDSTLIDQNEQLDSLTNELVFLENGMQQTRKRFNLGDLALQLYRIFRITFVAQYKNFLIQFLAFFLVINTIASFYDTRMTHANVCYSLEAEENAFNLTCREKLYNQALTEDYRFHQWFDIMLISLLVISMSALFFNPILKVFRNEHRNRWYSLATFYYAFMITSFIDMMIMSIFIAFVYYFAVDHLYVDNYRMNWYRFGHFFYFNSLNNFLQQSIGFITSLFFLDNFEVSIVLSYVILMNQQFINGYLFNPDKMKNIPGFFVRLSEFLSLEVPPNGLMYTMYGIDRCEDETTIPFVLEDFGVNIDTVYTDSFYMIFVIICFRLMIFVLMFLQFSGFKRSKKFIKASNAIKQIDYSNSSDDKTEIRDLSKTTRIKKDEELDFETFARHKIIVAWRSLTLYGSKSIYEIRTIKNEKIDSKRILKNINGQFRFGTLNALMGPSGAGKTSLLNILIGKSKSRMSEDTKFYLSRFTPIRVCYITQEVSGHLLPGLTAEQSLMFASRLKNATESADLDHEAIALKILNELDLSDIKDTFVQNCSGGQRKRLALGLELTSVRMPNLICIDEPTSGLDSCSAQVVTSCLKSVSHHHNICIITSIHQPTAEVFSMFDQVYVLAKGGVCVYSGPPCGIRSHLSKVSDRINQDDIFPVEELIKFSCLNYQNSSIKDLIRSTNEEILSEDSTLPNDTVHFIDGIPTTRNRFTLSSVWVLIIRYAHYVAGYLWKMLALLNCLFITFGLSLLAVFYDTDMINEDGCVNMEEDFNNTCNQTQEKEDEDFHMQTAFIYVCFTNGLQLFLILLQSSLMFSKEIVYFRNEHLNGWYSTGVFYSMKSLIEIVQIIPAIFIYTYLVDIYEPVRPGMFFWCIFFTFLGSLAKQAVGQLVAIFASGKFVRMMILIPSTQLLFLMVSNLGTPVRRLHYFYQFASYFAPTRHVMEGILLLLYGFERCRRKEVQKILYRLKFEDDEHGHHSSFFAQTIILIIFDIIVYRTIALLILLAKTNPYENRRKRASRIKEEQNKLMPLNVIIPGLQCHHELTIKQIQV